MKSYKYLIRIPNHLGDTIMAQPAVKAFSLSNQGNNVALLIPEWAIPIYENIGNTKIISLASNRLHGFSAILFQAKLLRSYSIETGVLLTPSFSSALAMFWGGIRNRFGYSGEGRQFFLNRCISSPESKIIHRGKKYKTLLERAGDKNLDNLLPSVSITDSQKKEAVELLGQHGVNRADRYIVIAPQAIAESRRWGTGNYSALAGRLTGSFDIKIVLIGTSDQYESGQRIALNRSDIKNLCGKTDIKQAASILSGASLFVGNDSGLAHLASAVKTPLLILSGADNPEETSPISDNKTVIIKDDLECISCVKNICPQNGDKYMRCMKEISIDEVFDAVSNLL